MTAQVTLQCLSGHYPKPITAKLLNSQSHDIPACYVPANHRYGKQCYPKSNAANNPYKRAYRHSENEDWRRVENFLVPYSKLLVNHYTSQPRAARDFPSSYTQANDKPVNILSLE